MDDRKWTFKKILKKFILIALGIALAIGIYGVFVYAQTQTIDNPKKCFTTSMYKINLCPTNPGYTNYSQVPKLFYRALILSEDASFYSHEGFDWFEIKESFRRNLVEWRFARGGSTITQQLAKNLYLTKEKSLDRKFKEFFISKQIEEKLTKTEILEKYVNVVEFGKNIYGINNASFHYFEKSPGGLNLLESIYLVSLLPNPKNYSKSFEEKKLSKTNLSRMNIILGRLYRTNRIDDDTYIYCQTLLETYDWPFHLYSDLDIPSAIKNTDISEELSEELENLNTGDDHNDELPPPNEEFENLNTEDDDGKDDNESNLISPDINSNDNDTSIIDPSAELKE